VELLKPRGIVREKGYWAWHPGGYVGLDKPDTFWTTD
jgi:hypothetical protein